MDGRRKEMHELLGGTPKTLGREEYNRRLSEFKHGRGEIEPDGLHRKVIMDTESPGDNWYGERINWRRKNGHPDSRPKEKQAGLVR